MEMSLDVTVAGCLQSVCFSGVLICRQGDLDTRFEASTIARHNLQASPVQVHNALNDNQAEACPIGSRGIVRLGHGETGTAIQHAGDGYSRQVPVCTP